MKFQTIFSCALLAGLVACSPRALPLFPKSARPCARKKFSPGPARSPATCMFPCAAGIGWVDAAGQIVTWDPEKNSAGTVYPLPFAVSEPPFCQGDFLVLRSQADQRMLIFDLARMETRYVAADLPAKQILAVDGEHLVYLDGENLVVCNWLKPEAIFRQAIGDQEIFNCHFLAGTHSDHEPPASCLFFGVQSGKFQLLPLPLAGGRIIRLPRREYLLRFQRSGSW